jgi:hypothetical protein
MQSLESALLRVEEYAAAPIGVATQGQRDVVLNTMMELHSHIMSDSTDKVYTTCRNAVAFFAGLATLLTRDEDEEIARKASAMLLDLMDSHLACKHVLYTIMQRAPHTPAHFIVPRVDEVVAACIRFDKRFRGSVIDTQMKDLMEFIVAALEQGTIPMGIIEAMQSLRWNTRIRSTTHRRRRQRAMAAIQSTAPRLAPILCIQTCGAPMDWRAMFAFPLALLAVRLAGDPALSTAVVSEAIKALGPLTVADGTYGSPVGAPKALFLREAARVAPRCIANYLNDPLTAEAAIAIACDTEAAPVARTFIIATMGKVVDVSARARRTFATEAVVLAAGQFLRSVNTPELYYQWSNIERVATGLCSLLSNCGASTRHAFERSHGVETLVSIIASLGTLLEEEGGDEEDPRVSLFRQQCGIVGTYSTGVVAVICALSELAPFGVPRRPSQVFRPQTSQALRRSLRHLVESDAWVNGYMYKPDGLYEGRTRRPPGLIPYRLLKGVDSGMLGIHTSTDWLLHRLLREPNTPAPCMACQDPDLADVHEAGCHCMFHRGCLGAKIYAGEDRCPVCHAPLFEAIYALTDDELLAAVDADEYADSSATEVGATSGSDSE